MRPFGDRIPAWPPAAAVCALAAALVVAALAPLGAAIPAAIAGLGRTSPAIALLGLTLCALYVATGSLLPGIALASAGSAVALGFACALAPAAVAGLAVGCALVSVALGAVPARERLGAARRPLLRGSAA
jgi:hypothetical protein